MGRFPGEGGRGYQDGKKVPNGRETEMVATGPGKPLSLSGPGSVGTSAALLCKVFDIQIKMVLVWENSAPQKTLIGACGNIYTYGELMKTLLRHLSRNLGNFTTSTGHSEIPFLYLQGDNEGDRATDGSPLLGPAGSKCPSLGLGHGILRQNMEPTGGLKGRG